MKWQSCSQNRSVFKILTGTPTEKRPLGKPRSRWKDNIRMHLKALNNKIEMGCHVARIEKVRSAFRILTGTPTGKRPSGRPRRRWEEILECILKH